MSDVISITRRLENDYSGLAPQVRKAARYVVKAPTEIALYSLREVAARAEVGPTTLVRLALQLGFTSYNAFRETFREGLRSGADRYASNVQRLQHDRARADFEQLYRDTGQLIVENIAATYSSISAADIAATAQIMKRARRLYILGLRSNYCLSFYLHYVLRTFMSNLVLLEGRMGMLIDELGDIGPRDALIAVSYEPYALEAVKAVEHAAISGAAVIAMTDTTLSPHCPSRHSIADPADGGQVILPIVGPNDGAARRPGVLPRRAWRTANRAARKGGIRATRQLRSLLARLILCWEQMFHCVDWRIKCSSMGL